MSSLLLHTVINRVSSCACFWASSNLGALFCTQHEFPCPVPGLAQTTILRMRAPVSMLSALTTFWVTESCHGIKGDVLAAEARRSLYSLSLEAVPTGLSLHASRKPSVKFHKLTQLISVQRVRSVMPKLFSALSVERFAGVDHQCCATKILHML